MKFIPHEYQRAMQSITSKSIKTPQSSWIWASAEQDGH